MQSGYSVCLSAEMLAFWGPFLTDYLKRSSCHVKLWHLLVSLKYRRPAEQGSCSRSFCLAFDPWNHCQMTVRNGTRRGSAASAGLSGSRPLIHSTWPGTAGTACPTVCRQGTRGSPAAPAAGGSESTRSSGPGSVVWGELSSSCSTSPSVTVQVRSLGVALGPDAG